MALRLVLLHHSKSMLTPRYCDFLEDKLVVDDGIETLDLRLCATCLVRSVAQFDSICFRFYIIVYTDGLIFP